MLHLQVQSRYAFLWTIVGLWKVSDSHCSLCWSFSPPSTIFVCSVAMWIFKESFIRMRKARCILCIDPFSCDSLSDGSLNKNTNDNLFFCWLVVDFFSVFVCVSTKYFILSFHYFVWWFWHRSRQVSSFSHKYAAAEIEKETELNDNDDGKIPAARTLPTLLWIYSLFFSVTFFSPLLSSLEFHVAFFSLSSLSPTPFSWAIKKNALPHNKNIHLW